MKKKLVLLLVVLLVLIPLSLLSAQAKHYTFYHLLWGLSDPNTQWHIKGGEAYMKMNPDVTIKFVGPENYDPSEHAKFLDTILKSNPDGICLHISSADALLPGLQEAKKRGIPIVSVTSHPPGADEEAKLKGLYLCWVGGDDQLVGTRMGERVLQSVKPVHVAYFMAHIGHVGQEARASGFFKSMPPGVKTDKIPIGDEPSHAKDVIRSYLMANPDVNIVFGCLPANKYTWDVVHELGRDNKITLLTSDEGPSSLEAVLQGKYLATFSQEFPIQAQLAYEILYLYKQTSMAPVAPVVTGPMVVDKTNAQQLKDLLIKFMGVAEYNKQSPW